MPVENQNNQLNSNFKTLKGNYKHYATYILMNKSRGIVRIDNYDTDSGNAGVSIIWGDPDPKEIQEKVFTAMNSGELLTYEDDEAVFIPQQQKKVKKNYSLMVE